MIASKEKEKPCLRSICATFSPSSSASCCRCALASLCILRITLRNTSWVTFGWCPWLEVRAAWLLGLYGSKNIFHGYILGFCCRLVCMHLPCCVVQVGAECELESPRRGEMRYMLVLFGTTATLLPFHVAKA